MGVIIVLRGTGSLVDFIVVLRCELPASWCGFLFLVGNKTHKTPPAGLWPLSSCLAAGSSAFIVILARLLGSRAASACFPHLFAYERWVSPD